MLSPDSSTLFTDAIRPPLGFELDRAVGTTYTLDLIALMLTQLTFASHDVSDTIDNLSPIVLLDAVQRNAHKTRVFVHGGAIKIPPQWRELLTLLEDSIIEVTGLDGVFHPKVWALRFKSEDQVRHRVLVSTRNLTFDNSWNTLLVLEEASPGTQNPVLSGEEIAEFLTELPAMSGNRASAHVTDLAHTLSEAQFTLPTPFIEARVRTTGVFGAQQREFRGERGLLIAPFLSQKIIEEFTKSVGESIVVSRAEELDRLGEGPENARLFTFKPEIEPSESGFAAEAEKLDSELEVSPQTGISNGLHAKIFITESGWNTRVLTGSMNATSAAFEKNVEFGVELTARRSRLKIHGIWGEDNTAKEGMGLSSLCMPYTPQQRDADSEINEQLQWRLAHHHHQLAGLKMVARIEPRQDDTFDLKLRISGLETLENNEVVTKIRPLTSKQTRHIAPTLTWSLLSLNAITPYLAVSSEIRSGDTKAACVLLADLENDPVERRDGVVKNILAHSDLSAYLLLLLTNPTNILDPAVQEALDATLHGNPTHSRARAMEPVLFEPLIQAATGNPRELDRFAHMISEIQRLGEADKIPPGILEMWTVLEPLVQAAQS